MAFRSLPTLLFLSSLLAFAVAVSAAKGLKPAVEGVVLCQSCSYAKTSSLTGSKPLEEAKVLILCPNGKNRIALAKTTTTGKDGYFFAALEGVTADKTKSCTVKLLTPPFDSHCGVPTNINGGLEGGKLRNEYKVAGPYQVYAVGPFAFKPFSCYWKP